MVDRVADQVDHGIGEALDHRLVEFGVLSGGDEFDGLVEIAGEVVDEPPEPPEQGTDRHHADPHGGVAQAGGEPLDFLRNGFDADVGAGVGELTEAGLGDDEFADAVHQFVEALGRHPDARSSVLGAPRIFAPRLGGRRRAGIGRG